MKPRKAIIKRTTRETKITTRMNLDGSGAYGIKTGLPFLDHMLELFSRHSLIDLDLAAAGDLAVDYHHTVEDIGLCIGQALNRALGRRSGIARYGFFILPMDDAASRVVVDLGGRPYLKYDIANRRRKINDFDLGLLEDFFRAFVVEGRMNLHIAQLYGKEPHHAFESVFKAVARAMRMAVARDPREQGIPSSKGAI